MKPSAVWRWAGFSGKALLVFLSLEDRMDIACTRAGLIGSAPNDTTKLTASVRRGKGFVLETSLLCQLQPVSCRVTHFSDDSFQA